MRGETFPKKLKQIKIKQLKPEEIRDLDVAAAQRVIAENSLILNEINNRLFTATRKLGEARIEVDQLKNDKSTIIEIMRALKSVISGG